MLASLSLALPLMTYQSVFATQTITYGDTNVEQFYGPISADVVQAYVRITVTQPVVITSVSLYLQYSGSAGNQCIKFGIYRDGGNISPAGQALVASTKNGYCLYGAAFWGPGWETWILAGSDYLTINSPGDYWLCILASYSFGNVYHYAPLFEYGYNPLVGYNDYFFPANYTTGFPSMFSDTPIWEAQAPYSFYVQGV